MFPFSQLLRRIRLCIRYGILPGLKLVGICWETVHPFTIASYEFGTFRVDADSRILLRDAKPVPLMPKAFDLLLVLIQNRGRVLDRDRLMSEVWPNTHVENTNLNVNLSMLRKVLGEKPRDHRYIVTIPGKGYKFVAAVKVPENRRHWRASSAKLLTFAEEIRKKWIAVLPFSWVGRRPGDGWLALGITDSLTVDLARIPQLRVQLTDRAVGWTARRRSIVATERKGDVDYLLQGRIQRLDGKIRVTVQLISARNSQLLWARKFDGMITNGFSLQDSISAETTREISKILEMRTPRALAVG